MSTPGPERRESVHGPMSAARRSPIYRSHYLEKETPVNRTSLIVWFLAAAAGTTTAPLAAQSAPSTSEKGVVVRSVSKWDSTCSGNNISSWDNMVEHWYDEITDGGAHGVEAFWQDGFYVNGWIVDSDFTDPSIASWGNDDADDRLDEADFFALTMHGSDASDLRWQGSVRSDEAGSGNCSTYQGSMLFGDSDLEMIFLSSCYSMDQGNWFDEWESSFGGAHQIHGFHGVMWISWTYYGRHTDYADDSFYIATADALVDNMFINNALLSGDDQCPVAQGVGSDTTDLWDRVDHEQYDWMFSDPTGLRNGTVYVGGCDPQGKGAL
jgi:hypothetical protein